MEKMVIDSDVWRSFAINPNPDFTPPRWDLTIDRNILVELLHHCYKSFYLRPGYIGKQLLKIRSFKEFNSKTTAGFSLLYNQVATKVGLKSNEIK
jgi:hypothetical protein